jgi:hypothetical protein
MYRILVHIHGQKQIKRMAPQRLLVLESIIQEVAHHYGAIFVNQHPYELRLPSDYTESTFVAIQATFGLHHDLLAQQRLFYGSAIILASDDDFQQADLLRYIYLTNEDNKIWVPTYCVSIFSSWLDMQVRGELATVSKLKPRRDTIRIMQNEYLFNQALYNVLIAMVDRVKKTNKSEILRIFGMAGTGKRFTVQQFLKPYSLLEGFQFMWINPTTQGYDFSEPFRRSLSSHVVDRMGTYLSADEEILWSRLRGLIGRIHGFDAPFLDPDSLFYDYTYLIFFYIKAYKAICLKQGYPPCLVIEDELFFTDSSRLLLQELIASAQVEELAIIIISTRYDESVDDGSFIYDNDQRLLVMKDELGSSSVSRRAFSPYAHILKTWHEGNTNKTYSGKVELEPVLRWLVQSLDLFSQKVLLLVGICNGMIGLKQLMPLFPASEQEKLSAYQRLQIFLDLQLVSNAQYPHLAYPMMDNWVRNVLGSDAIVMERAVALNLYELYAQGCNLNTWHLYRLLERCGCVSQGFLILQRCLGSIINRHYKESASLVKQRYFATTTLSSQERERLKTILYTAHIRKKMLDLKCGMSMEEFFDQDDLPYIDATDNTYINFYLLQKCRYINALGQGEESFRDIKNLVFSFQTISDHYGEALTNIELAYSLFLQGKFRQALDFCEISQRICKQLNFGYDYLIALEVEVISYFSYGNWPAALRTVYTGIQLSDEVGSREKWLFFCFVRMRLEFELGRYAVALDTLDEMIYVAHNYDKMQILAVCELWRGRLLAYLNRHKEAQELFSRYPGRESSYFHAESLYFQGNLIEALAVARWGVSLPILSYYILSEFENWQDGFLLIEGRLEGLLGYNVLNRLLLGLMIFLECRLGGKKERIDQLLVFEKTPAQDPFAYLYFIYIALIRQSIGDQDGLKLSLSRAHRLLTARSGRFDELNIREDFFKGNYWYQHCLKESGLRDIS